MLSWALSPVVSVQANSKATGSMANWAMSLLTVASYVQRYDMMWYILDHMFLELCSNSGHIPQITPSNSNVTSLSFG